jgi:hypothetical protein
MTNSEKHLKTVGGILSKRGKLSASEPVGCNWVGDTRVMQAQGFALFGGFSSHTGSLGTLWNTMEHYGALWNMEHYGTLWNFVMMVSHSVSREGRFC